MIRTGGANDWIVPMLNNSMRPLIHSTPFQAPAARLTAGAALLTAVTLLASPQAAPAEPPAYAVMPVLFVPTPSSFPAGYQPTPEQLAADLANINEAMGRLQTWYAAALGRTTSFNALPAVQLPAQQGLAYYGITWTNPARRYSDGISISGSFWGFVNAELSNRGYGPGTANAPRMTVTFCKGAGGYAGGAQWFAARGGGMCILGDWCLDSLAGRVPAADWSWWTGKDRQTSAAGHEMGHTIGLPHPDATNPVTNAQDWAYTIMGWWWDWPTFPANPADPGWPLRGLHAWANNSGPTGPTPGYQDAFLLAHRSEWFNASLADGDGDGVPDFRDQCPDTPAGRPVNELGCPLTSRADLDGDGDVDLEDFGRLQACLTGPGVLVVNPNCLNARMDSDGDVDLDDVGIFQACMRGAGVLVDPSCGDK